ncbi:hypothetical protein MCOR27_004503 [Pyricularia oryzae]|uniref:Peptide hydrolase n=5 Tax=Pyricularia TaxID=48558 RepID=A0ABQ8NHR4_PYRGI|nr:uncharacterized protein MGG_13012 [Pyricularia oryzae 70-15]ELQ38269.1 leucine aminopeptidase 2 [Pyricularia oryzae Y34]KAI6257985.1 hypothetical protein MCOR19_005649 [Pyricularia oryzae]KAI6297267.1 hypothetical protein MCOR33_006322 [Pyricularia grisea]EHA52353.1 hypothetical protein MGG_13012 [Pyricularia oryzae 70-15]KAI6273881.1 hypothetical protein MCOR26_006744 [Pyricularia oryzae]
MQITRSLVLLATSGMLASAAPTAKTPADDASTERHLVKVAPADPGTWLTDEEKDVLAVNRVGFHDITGVSEEELAVLSADPDEVKLEARQAVTYPTTLANQAEAVRLSNQATTTNPQSWLTTLSNFQTRHYRSSTGTQAGTWLQQQLRSIVGSKGTVSTITHSFNQPSIIVRIPGQTSNLVITGAHYDSTGGSTTARSPGAEDDGSGVVVIMEALRVLVASSFAPKNTLEFHFYGGEEGGLLGSRDVFANYRSNGRRVLAYLNQDMSGYSPGGKLTIYTDYVDTGLTAYVRRIAQASAGVAPSSSSCGYGCSDHASARSNGFPAAYVGDEPIGTSATWIHSSNDSIDRIQWPTILRHAKFVINYLVEASYL